MKPAPQSNEAGFALVAVILILALLMGLAATLTTAVTMDSGLRAAFDRATTGFYAAEAGLNHGMGDFRNIFLNFNVPNGSDFDPRSFTLGQRTVTYQLTDLPTNPQAVTIPSGQVFGGLKAIQYTYIANSQAQAKNETEADVSMQFDVSYIPLFQFVAFYTNDLEIMPGADMHLHGRIHTNSDLYLNSDAHLWIEDNQGAAVPVNQRITSVQCTAKGDIYRGRKNDTSCTGLVTVDKLEDAVPPSPDLDPQDLNCSGGTTKVSASTLSSWKGSMLSQVQSISVPQPDVIAAKTGTFWEHADLRIVLRLDQLQIVAPWPGCAAPCQVYGIEVQDVAGQKDDAKTARLLQFMSDTNYNLNFSSMPGTRPIFYTDVPTGTGGCTCTDASPNGCNNAAAACYSPVFSSDARVYSGNINVQTDSDYRRGGFYNRRAQKWMYLLDINMHDLLDWNARQPGGSGFFDAADNTDGGLVIYVTVQGPNSNALNNYGVRLFGSRNLPFPPVAAGGDPTGLTVASDQSVYVLGDYNRGNTAAGDLPKQPAAVLGDTINILSQNYFNASTCGNDCQSNRSLNDPLRNAVTTTINSAFLAGVDLTTPGNYNGGLENYPRFHESWSGQTLNYRGSFVSLGTPQHVNAPWCGTGGSNSSGCNIYNPPSRNFDYDADFNDVKNLPPLVGFH